MNRIELSEDQKQSILDFWNKTPGSPPSVKDIAFHLFGEAHDHRTPESKGIIAFLASRRLRPKPRFQTIEISEPHKEFIKNNASSMNACDMARTIFNNPALTNLSAETRAINAHLTELDKTEDVHVVSNTREVPQGDYRSPDTVHKVLRKVNLYTNDNLTIETLSPILKKGLESLIKYLHNYHIVKQINIYDIEDDRKSFEDAFIRYTYNKPDLSQEEVGQYCVLANEIVLSFKAQRRSEKLQRMLEDITDTDPESAKISMSLVEAISKATNEYSQCVSRQQKLLDDLTEKRSDKLSKQIKDNASVLNLIQDWKQESVRKKWFKLAALEDAAIDKEIDKLDSMSEIKARIFGLTKEEARYG